MVPSTDAERANHRSYWVCMQLPGVVIPDPTRKDLLMSARLRRVTSTGDSGASAVEYGLLVAGIAALIVGIIFVFGTFVTGIFEDTCTEIGTQADVGNPDNTLPDCPTT